LVNCLFQDIFILLFKPESERAKGTLAYIRALLRQTAVGLRVPENFDQCQEFLELVTEAYILTLALLFLGIKKVTDKLKGKPAAKERHVMLCETASRIVDFCFRTPDVEATLHLGTSQQDG